MVLEVPFDIYVEGLGWQLQAFIDSLQSQSPLEGLCRDTDICAIVEKAKQEKTAE